MDDDRSLTYEGDRKTVCSAVSGALRPPEKMNAREWADEKRFLPEYSAEPGRWRTSRTPYLREILECIGSDDGVRQVTLMKPAQCGGSEVILNGIGRMVDIDPGPALVVGGTEQTALAWSRERLKPLLESTPALAEKFSDNQRDPDNATRFKRFPGGFLGVAYATSASELASRPIRDLYLDEVDRYPASLGREGDPVRLAMARTETFADVRLIVAVSTPTVAGVSKIEALWKTGDQSILESPCPHCGVYQTLHPERMVWESGCPEDAHFLCSACDERIEEHHKTQFLPRVRWVAQRPEVTEHRSFHLLGTYAPLGWSSWAKMAQAWEEASTDEDRVSIKNLKWGIPADVERVEQLDWEKLYLRRESRSEKIQSYVGALTAGVDVQGDRLECEVVGWGRGMRSSSVEYLRIFGDPTQQTVWDELEEVLRKRYAHPLGGYLEIERMAVDTGYLTDDVYAFGRRDRQKILMVKGSTTSHTTISAPRAVEVTRHGKKVRRGLALWTLNTDHIKNRIFRWLELPLPSVDEETGEVAEPLDGWCEWPQYGEQYFRGLCSEERVLKNGKWRWRKTFERNEPLDCRVYAQGAAMILGLERWDEARWQEKLDEMKAKKGHSVGSRFKKSSYLGG